MELRGNSEYHNLDLQTLNSLSEAIKESQAVISRSTSLCCHCDDHHLPLCVAIATISTCLCQRLVTYWTRKQPPKALSRVAFFHHSCQCCFRCSYHEWCSLICLSICFLSRLFVILCLFLDKKKKVWLITYNESKLCYGWLDPLLHYCWLITYNESKLCYGWLDPLLHHCWLITHFVTKLSNHRGDPAFFVQHMFCKDDQLHVAEEEFEG